MAHLVGCPRRVIVYLQLAALFRSPCAETARTEALSAPEAANYSYQTLHPLEMLPMSCLCVDSIIAQWGNALHK